MAFQTNLRALRHRHGLRLTELEAVSGLRNQYISKAELGQVQVTARLERQLEAAVETIIALRENELLFLKRDYQMYKGHLLQLTEDTEHER